MRLVVVAGVFVPCLVVEKVVADSCGECGDGML